MQTHTHTKTKTLTKHSAYIREIFGDADWKHQTYLSFVYLPWRSCWSFSIHPISDKTNKPFESTRKENMKAINKHVVHQFSDTHSVYYAVDVFILCIVHTRSIGTLHTFQAHSVAGFQFPRFMVAQLDLLSRFLPLCCFRLCLSSSVDRTTLWAFYELYVKWLACCFKHQNYLHQNYFWRTMFMHFSHMRSHTSLIRFDVSS